MGTESKELNSRELELPAKNSAIYINSKVIWAKDDEISILEMHMKAHDVFHNLIQPIPNHMVYERRGTEWHRCCTEKKKILVVGRMDLPDQVFFFLFRFNGRFNAFTMNFNFGIKD